MLTFILIDGGTADIFWGYIASALGMSFVYASLAEMASMCVYSLFPHFSLSPFKYVCVG